MLRRHDVHGQAAVPVPGDGEDVQGRGDDVQRVCVPRSMPNWSLLWPKCDND